MKILIIGAGPAGVSAAEAVRSFDQQVEITMLTDEPYQPYSPPAMADHFINGTDLHFWRPADWAEQFGVNYRKGVKVESIEPVTHQLRLVDGEKIQYDRLLIASGARLYAPVQGADMPGIYNFKSLSAAENLVGKVHSGHASTALIVGAGFIGMEIALLLQELGLKVIQVEMLDQVMASMLDADTAKIAVKLMRARGVEVRLNTKAVAFTGNRKAEAIKLESGDELKADIMIAATGVMPNVELLHGSGIDTRRGIIVDEHLQTSVPDIYAAGDCIESPYRLTGEMYVHAIFPNAVEQGRVAGMNMAGYSVAYEGADKMNSLKHLGLSILAAGEKQGELVLQEHRGDQLKTIYLKDSRIVGFQLAGDIKNAGIYHTLMTQKYDVSHLEGQLLNPNFAEGVLAWKAIGAYA